MKTTSSYAVELKHISKIFYPTIKIYQRAVSFCVSTFENEWSSISSVTDSKQRKGYAERLIHSTKSNQAKYPEFDKQFFKLPSYLRRSAINTALGHLQSYHSNLENWLNSKQTTKKPVLQVNLNKLPTFYKDNTYDGSLMDADSVSLKLFVNNDWIWVPFTLKHTDIDYIRKQSAGSKLSVPTLEKKHKKWFLRFSFEENVKLTTSKDIVLAVDLRLNTDATCCVMNKEGTVLKRKFINFKSDKDSLYHTLNKIKKVSRLQGPKNTAKLWRIAKFKNDELARHVSSAILELALVYQVDVIVFEHLDIKGKKRGANKQKLHMWKKNTIQQLVLHKAHRHGIRISRVCPYNTSKLAYDGSGYVLRGDKANLPTYELCQFTNGKIYNCDLSASYNIAARYFIREIEKSTSVMKWSQAVANVKSLAKRTLNTYSSYLELLSLA